MPKHVLTKHPLTTLGLVVALILAFCPAAKSEKLVIGYSAVSALQLPYWIAKDAGLFRAEGLDSDLVYVSSSPTMAQAMLGGNIAISTANSQVITDIGMQGGDLVAVGAGVNVIAFYVLAPPEINSIKDLKGKTVGVTRFGSVSDFAMRYLLQKYGLEPIRDVPLVQIGGQPEQAAALSKRLIYAAAISYPMVYVAEQAGMKILTNLAKEDVPFLHVGITTSRSFLTNHRPQVKAVLRAYSRAVHFMYSRKDSAKAILARYSKISDPGMIDGSLQYAYDFLEKIPLVKPQAFQSTLDESAKKNPKAKQVRPEQFYDNSLVQEMVDEGFFKALWSEPRK